MCFPKAVWALLSQSNGQSSGQSGLVSRDNWKAYNEGVQPYALEDSVVGGAGLWGAVVCVKT